MKEWCTTNNIKYVENEQLFEFRNGDIDEGSYIMTGETPAVHLTRPATIRLLRNIQKAVPEMIVSEKIHENTSYANVFKLGYTRRPAGTDNNQAKWQQQKQPMRTAPGYYQRNERQPRTSSGTDPPGGDTYQGLLLLWRNKSPNESL